MPRTAKADLENKALRSELEELKAMLQSVMAGKSVESPASVVEKSNRNGDEDLRPDDYINVVSLYPHTLNLNTDRFGKGRKFTFNKFGQTLRILYSDLVAIMGSHTEYTNFLEDGYYYIADERVVRRHGLDDLYAKILTKEKIQKLIDGDLKTAKGLFESTNAAQKEIICDILVTKMTEGKEIDLNFLDFVKKDTGIDVATRAKDAKFYQENK